MTLGCQAIRSRFGADSGSISAALSADRDQSSASLWAIRTTRLATIRDIRTRLAEPADLDAVGDLLSEAAAWTASIGFPNWPARFSRELLALGIADRTLYVVEIEGAVVATLTLQWRDELFWGDCADDAGYVHRLAVRRDHAGARLGGALLDWAARQVGATNRTWLRLDASADNLRLCAFYERLGFEYRGDAEGEYPMPNGEIRQWRSRRYERAATEGTSE